MIPRTEYITASQKLHSGRAALLSISIAADGANGTVTAYDGQDTLGKTLTKVIAFAGETKQIVFPKAALCESGLFISVGESTSGVTVSYVPLREGPCGLDDMRVLIGVASSTSGEEAGQ